MTQQIRVIVESLNDAGEVIGKNIIMTKSIIKPDTRHRQVNELWT